MLKKRYIKKAYINVAYCDKCGGPMVSAGFACLTSPPKFPYKCSNPSCDFVEIFEEYEQPGVIQYEYEVEN